MSLRREVHSAFDVITPPLGGMPERVVQTVLSDARRRRKGRFMLRLRAPLSLVAVFLVVAVIAAILVGGRVIQDWRIFGSVPSKGGSSQLAQLEARPLNLPVLHSISDCTAGPFNSDNSAIGAGPLYAYAGSKFIRTTSADYSVFVIYTDQRIAGPILVRGRDLLGNAVVVFVGPWAGGRVVGKDVLNGATVQTRAELVLNESDARPVVDNPPATPHPFVWQFTAGTPLGAVATGWQIDGLTFSEMFLVC